MTVPTTRTDCISLSATVTHRPPWAGIHTGNEVERQVHEVSDNCLGTEAGEGRLEDLAEPGHRVAARLQLPALADDVGSVSRHESAVEDVEQRVLQEEVAGQDGDDGRALAENQDNRGEHGKWSVHEHQDSELRHVGKGEHRGHHADRESDGRNKLRQEGLPQ